MNDGLGDNTDVFEVPQQNFISKTRIRLIQSALLFILCERCNVDYVPLQRPLRIQKMPNFLNQKQAVIISSFYKQKAAGIAGLQIKLQGKFQFNP